MNKYAQGDWIHPADFRPFLTNNFDNFLLPIPFLKGVYYKRKKFAAFGSKLFHFREDPFLEGNQDIF